MSGFELSRRFEGETIECNVLVWHPRFESRGSAEMTITRAPHSTTILGIGFEGEWKVKPFLLDPRQKAIRIGNQWILISDIDAASQFTVEKEHAVAFPHESKQIYVSGHVGLHLHVESTGEAFTMAFGEYQLADVAFDAVNKISYDTLSTQIFQEEEADDGDPGDLRPKKKTTGTGTGGGGSSRKINKAAAGGGGGTGPAAATAAAAAAASSKHHDDHHDDDDDNFVAMTCSELEDRGRQVNTNDFTTFFLEGGGMGSLSEVSKSSTSSGPPSGGMMRLRKETGSLSTWIARMEEGDNEHLYMMKLSKAAIKAPLNRLIRASRPSIAAKFGPVVPLAFQHLTIRSEASHAQFVLEEVYVAENGDTRVHRLICVFASLDERIRWEDWLQSHGVKKKAIAPSTQKKKDDAGEDGADGADGRGGGKHVDTTMKLIEECFRLDEVWDHPRDLADDPNDEDDDAYYEDDGTINPFVGDTPRNLDGSPRSLSFESAQSSPRLKSPPPRASLPGSPGVQSQQSVSSLRGSPRRKSASAAQSGVFGGAEPAESKPVPVKTEEQELSELEALQRCRWFAGYQPARENKWSTLSSALKKERSAGSNIFTAVAKLRADSAVFGSAASMADFDEDAGRAHIMGGSPNTATDSPTSPKAKLSALIRAGQLKRAVDALSRHQEELAKSPDGTTREPASPSTQRAIAALNELDAAEQDAMMKEIQKQQDDADTERQLRSEDEQQQQLLQRQQQQQDPSSMIIDYQSSGARSRQTTTPASSSAGSTPQPLPLSHTAAMVAARNQQQQQQQQRSGVFSSASSSVFDPQQKQLSQRSGSPASASGGAAPTISTFVSEAQANAAAAILTMQHQQQAQAEEESPGSVVGSTTSARKQGVNVSVPRELTQRFEAQRRQQHQQRFLGEALADGSSSSMFGRPTLFGDSKPPLFTQINLRSEGYVDDDVVMNAMNSNKKGHSTADGGDGKATAAAASSRYPGSPAADEARDFSFGFNSPGGASSIHPARDWSSALYGDTSTTTTSQQQQQQQSPRRLVETSSDSDDESSRRFANARAMRAVTQLGEEFVGVGFSTSGTRAATTNIGVTSLSNQLQPICPLCNADRGSVAICKKTGRLHASLVPRYADATRRR